MHASGTLRQSKDQYHLPSTLGNPTVGWQNCVEYQKTARNSTDIFFNDRFHYVQST